MKLCRVMGRPAKATWPTLDLGRAALSGDDGELVVGTTRGERVTLRPRMVVGDEVWFRETWSPDGGQNVYPCPGTWYRADVSDDQDPALRLASAKKRYTGHDPGGWRFEDVCLRQCVAADQWECLACYAAENGFRWHSALHMPKSRCRTRARVTEVRFERLQSISDEDCRREGIVHDGTWWQGAPHRIKGTPKAMPTARLAYQDLWTHLNGEGSWAENPWVLVIGFVKK